MTTSTNHSTILLYNIHKEVTNEALKEKMIRMEGMLALSSHKSGFLLSIGGCDQDSREVWGNA